MTTTATPSVTETSARAPRKRPAAIASDAAATMRTAAEDAATKLPDMAAMGRSAFEDASRRIDTSSDEVVRLGTALSFGFAAGLLIGGANRILVGAAFIPVAMLGMTLLERSSENPVTSATTSPGGL